MELDARPMISGSRLVLHEPPDQDEERKQHGFRIR